MRNVCGFEAGIELAGDLDRLAFETLVVFGGSGEAEGVRLAGRAVFDGSDEVAAADPVSLGEVGGRPAGGVIGMGMVEADDVETALAAGALDADELLRSDVVA